MKKRYLRPATPCDRLLASEEIDDDTRDRLREIRARLDPIALLERIRTERRILADIASGSDVVEVDRETTDLDQFVQSLAVAFRGGEVRATHRRRLTEPRYWRTRADPFEDVWEALECRLENSPDTTAKALFDELCAQHPERFIDSQLRTLQRRVKAWRTTSARKLLALDAETAFAQPHSVRSCVSHESSIGS